MPLSYFRGDELPAWEASITLNGVAPDFSTGWEFTVTLRRLDEVIPKTDGITGTADGVIVVAWEPGDLDIAEGTWAVQLTATDTFARQVTVSDRLTITARLLDEEI